MRELARVQTERESCAARRGGRVEVGYRVAVGRLETLIVGRGAILEEREFAVSQKGMHVSAKLPRVVVNLRKLVVRTW